MKFTKRFLLLCSIAALLIAALPFTAFAQDEMVVCDSTLATLLLVAEYDYGYLSSKMTDAEMAEAPALRINKGQFGPVVDSIVATMMMMAEEMTEEDMAMTEDMNMQVMGMMEMSSAGMVAAYMGNMDMEMGMTTELTPGNVAGEDPLCAEVRADVEAFILAHILSEMEMMAMEGDM